jgi:hypothetical protein
VGRWEEVSLSFLSDSVAILLILFDVSPLDTVQRKEITKDSWSIILLHCVLRLQINIEWWKHSPLFTISASMPGLGKCQVRGRAQLNRTATFRELWASCKAHIVSGPRSWHEKPITVYVLWTQYLAWIHAIDWMFISAKCNVWNPTFPNMMALGTLGSDWAMKTEPSWMEINALIDEIPENFLDPSFLLCEDTRWFL